MHALSEPRAPKTVDGLRVRAALRAADGDLIVAARALRMSTRDVLQVLLCAPSQDRGGLQSGTRRRFEIEPDAIGGTNEEEDASDGPDRPAWTDDDDSWGDASG